MNNYSWLDGTLYPDTDIPDTLDTLAARVDFLARLCAAWDFGLLPDAGTIEEILREEWRPAVEACRQESMGPSTSRSSSAQGRAA